MNKKALQASFAQRIWHFEGEGRKLLSFGAPVLDEPLRGGIISQGLHEFFGSGSNPAAAAAFALLLTLRLPESKALIFWIGSDRERQFIGKLYPPGLAELGVDPDRILLVQTKNLKDALRAAADCIRSKAAAAVILEAQGSASLIDLTSTRRLALAASEMGVLALLIRSEANPIPSAAVTRWQVRSAPSSLFPGDVPGFATFDLALLRHRTGVAPFAARVTWDHAARSFQDVPLSGGLSAIVTRREADPGSWLQGQ
jgi:protein ImuA